MVNWIHFPKNKPLDEVSAQIVKAFEAVDATIDENIKPENIRKGINILGVDGSYDANKEE